jgi:hypothetical protein
MTTENEENVPVAEPTYEELDAAADQPADEQHLHLTRCAALELGDASAEKLAATAAAYDAAVRAAQPIYGALADYELDHGDPADVAAEALERDRAEEYARHLADEEELGLDAAEYVLERVAE